MSFILLGILSSQASAGFDPESFYTVFLDGADSEAGITEKDGVLIIWRGNGNYWLQTGGPGTSFTALTVDNNVGAFGANANVFIAVPRGSATNSVKISTTGASGSWTTAPNSSTDNYGERRAVIASPVDPNAFYISGRVGEMETDFIYYSLNNGVSGTGPLTYAQQSHRFNQAARSSSEWMIQPTLSNFNSNDFVYFIGNGTSWTQYTSSLNWNDGGRSVTTDGTYFYGTRSNSKQLWKRTGTNTFTTAPDPLQLNGNSVLHYAFGTFFFWLQQHGSYWYSDTWNSGYTQVSIGSTRLNSETRFNGPQSSETNQKVYVSRVDQGGFIAIG